MRLKVILFKPQVISPEVTFALRHIKLLNPFEVAGDTIVKLSVVDGISKGFAH